MNKEIEQTKVDGPVGINGLVPSAAQSNIGIE